MVSDSIKVIIDEHFARYEKITSSFQQFFNQDELSTLIDRKADLELVRRI